MRSVVRDNLSPDINDFARTLASEVEQLIIQPLPTSDVKGVALGRKVANAVDEQTKPMMASFAEAEAQGAAIGANHSTALQSLRNEIEALQREYKSKTDRAIRELDGERIATVRRWDSEQAQVRECEARLASLRLFRAEVEARERHQKTEREMIERSLLQQTEQREEWDGPGFDDEALSQELRHIVALVRNVPQEERANSPYEALEDGIRLLNAEADEIRMQIAELDAFGRLLPNPSIVQIPVQIQAVPPPNRRQKSTLVSEAEAKVNQIRRSRGRNMP
jgi:hypothetical protein